MEVSVPCFFSHEFIQRSVFSHFYVLSYGGQFLRKNNPNGTNIIKKYDQKMHGNALLTVYHPMHAVLFQKCTVASAVSVFKINRSQSAQMPLWVCKPS